MIFVLWKVGFSIGRLNYFSNEYFITVIFFFIEYTSAYVFCSPCGRLWLSAVWNSVICPALRPTFFFFFLHRAAVMKHLFLFFNFFFKIQSNNIIQQCFPCYYFANSYIECNCTVYFLNFIWLAPVKTMRRVFHYSQRRFCPSRWGLLFLKQLSFLLSLPLLYLNSIESVSFKKKCCW